MKYVVKMIKKSNMKKYICILVFISCLYTTKADEIYFIIGHPRNDIMNQFPTSLVCYKSENSIEKIEVISDTLETISILPYYEQGVINLFAQDLRRNDFYCFRLNMNDPKAWSSIPIIEPGYSFIKSYQISLDGDGKLFIEFYGKEKEPKLLLKEFDFDNNVNRNADEDDLVNLIVTGSPSGAVGGSDQTYMYLNNDNDLLLPVTADITKRPLMSIKLPDSHQFDPNDRIALYVNIKEFMMISSRSMRKNDEHGRTHTKIWIYKKDIKEWDKLNIAGIPTFYRGFGNWMAGTVTERTKGKNNSKVTVEKKELPGKEKRNKKLRKTGTPVDYRYDSFEIYSDGQLFLYNVETKKKITINTEQGDSEVLLIDGDILYYRVYDSIYQATIKNGKIENEQIILQDEYVPDIHWAFISKP
jgi:hypothetical protein